MKIKLFIITLLLSYISYAQESVTPWMGVQIENHKQGVFIKDALKGTPAEKAGLTRGLIVQFIDGKPVKSTTEMIEIIRSKGVGHKVTVKMIDQKGKKVEKSLKLVARPGLIELAEKNLLNQKAPDFNLDIVNKGEKGKIKLSKSKKITILEFWATWCGACAAALPTISKFAIQNKDKIQFISISSEAKPKIRKYIHFAKQKMAYNGGVKFVHDSDGKVNGSYFVPALPMFFVIDKKGIIKHIAVGTGEELVKVFNKALKLSKQ